MTAFAYIAAALAEIAGCFAFWAWLRLDRSPLWIAPGVLSLIAFAPFFRIELLGERLLALRTVRRLAPA